MSRVRRCPGARVSVVTPGVGVWVSLGLALACSSERPTTSRSQSLTEELAAFEAASAELKTEMEVQLRIAALKDEAESTGRYDNPSASDARLLRGKYEILSKRLAAVRIVTTNSTQPALATPPRLQRDPTKERIYLDELAKADRDDPLAQKRLEALKRQLFGGER